MPKDIEKPKNYKTVWVLLVTYKHGDDITVFDSREKALVDLDDFVKEYWDDWLSETLIPNDRQERIDAYFENQIDFVFHEFYTLEEKEIQ